MNIGVDLDDTINSLSPILFKYAKEYNIINGIKHNINRNEWDFDKAFGWDEQDVQKFINKYIPQVFAEAKPKENAIEIMKKLKKDEHKIIVITARHDNDVKDVYHISKDWLKKYDIPCDRLIVNSSDKAEKCKENNINIFIDDSIQHCENVRRKLKIPVYLFDSEYNQKYQYTNIKRIYSWNQFYEEISNIDNSNIL